MINENIKRPSESLQIIEVLIDCGLELYFEFSWSVIRND